MLATAVLLLVFADNPELEALKKVDQADRSFVSSPSEIKWEIVSVRDAARQQRVRELLLADQVRTAQDFDNAALIMQHGSRPSDYLLAHELGAIAAYMGNLGSLPALAEDRWLESIGRQQRWGSQFDWDGNVKEMDTAGAAVTDGMRSDLLLPTLDEIKRLGMKAAMNDIDAKLERLQGSLDKSKWKPNRELRKGVSPRRALQIVRSGLSGPEDYVNAAKALSTSRDPKELLLAHELSLLAMSRHDERAPQLFAKTMDAYLAATGLPKRYAVGGVAPGVRRLLLGRAVPAY
jgi:hypothetical protein